MKDWTSVEWHQMMRLSHGVLLSLLCSSFLRMSLWLGQIQGELLSVCELWQILEQCSGTLNSLLKDTLTVRRLLLKSYSVVLLTVTNVCVCASFQANCASLGATLASVHDVFDYSFLQELTTRSGGSASWMGGFYFQVLRPSYIFNVQINPCEQSIKPLVTHN